MAVSPDQEELIGTTETARRLGVHENTVRNLANKGILPVARVLPGSGFRRFSAADVDRLAEQMTRQAPGAEPGSR